MFWTRLASGIVLLIVAISTIALGNYFLLIPLWMISLIAFRELTKALGCAGEMKSNLLEIVGFIGLSVYYLAVWLGHNGSYGGNPLYLFLAIAVFFLAEMVSYVAAFPKYRSEHVMGAVFSFLYAPVMLSFVYLTREAQYGIYMVWLILISSWGSDTCAYAVGKLLGRKRIFPVLSPHKSLEGCIGGILGAALIGAIYAWFFVEQAFPEKTFVFLSAFICAAGAVMSMVGDLAASAIKRNHDIKDYGKLIPGHGGIMDRFDSMIITAPVIYTLTVLFV